MKISFILLAGQEASVDGQSFVAGLRGPVVAALRFLPTYSPDFNPIEKASSRLRGMVRKAAERTVSGL